MQYEDLIGDFAKRTLKNLEFVRRCQKEEKDDLFEVTQLVNSMLGLLVFPHEKYLARIPETSLDELKRQGCSIPITVFGIEPQNLRELVRLLRNSIAHCNIEFFHDERGQIKELSLWNKRWNDKTKVKEITWKGKLAIGELDMLVLKFVDILSKDANSL